MSSIAPSTNFRAIGFCGVDDSVHPNMLAIISHSYPFVEFGVLFRPDQEGDPRYPTKEWVEKLGAVSIKCPLMRLAAHLCANRVNDVVRGKDAFVVELKKKGFQRFQLNPTARNGADTSILGECAAPLCALVNKHPDVEFILQQNEETRPLWEGLLKMEDESSGGVGGLPANISMLVDESKGTGKSPSYWPKAAERYKLGYAGGIGPDNIEKVLQDVAKAGQGQSIWIDMESRIRSIKDGKDIFDLDKCYKVIEAVCAAGFHPHPEFLPA